MPPSYRTESEREPGSPLSDPEARVHANLRISEARLEAAQAQALIGSWEQGADPTDFYWSKQMYALYGFDQREAPPSQAEILERIHPDDRQALREAARSAAVTGKPARVEFRSNPAFGTTRYFEVCLQSQLGDAGQPVRTIGTTQDITERKQIEEALKLSQTRLESAQAQAKIGSWEYNPLTKESFWSKQMYALYGLEPGTEVPSVDAVLEQVHPEDRAMVFDAPLRAIALRQSQYLVYRRNPRLGALRYFEFNTVPEYDKEGQLCRLTGTTQDVTERELTTEALRESEQRLQRLVQNSADIIVVLDADGTQRSLLGPLKAILGYEPKELAGTNAFTLMHPEDGPKVQPVLLEAMANPGVPYRVEYRCRHKQGGWVDMEAVGTNWLHDPSIEGLVVNLRQTTERKQAEQERAILQEQLQQATKMEAVGRLAGGVAHDFNNLLTVIIGNVELALIELDRANPLVSHLSDVTAAANSAAALTHQLLAFSRRQLIEPKIVNLNDLIAHLHKMLNRLIGEDISLEMKTSSELGSVRIDPGQFDQVLINLAVNARDAMPKGGRLTIETANVELDEYYCRRHGDLRPGQFVALQITDDGEGMSAEVLSHIFEPFFTTKPQGSGTGLGLAVIFGVVKQAGGAIETYSEVGLGTTFKIYLPRVDEPAQKLANTMASAEALRGTETILLVEDNESVRELTATILRRLGYNLLVSDNGKNALRLIKDEPRAIHLLLTDLIMPEMSGHELSTRIRGFLPDIAVLYCSGYTEDIFIRHGLASENLQFIGKPFTVQQLGLKVRQVLDEKRAATASIDPP